MIRTASTRRVGSDNGSQHARQLRHHVRVRRVLGHIGVVVREGAGEVASGGLGIQLAAHPGRGPVGHAREVVEAHPLLTVSWKYITCFY